MKRLADRPIGADKFAVWHDDRCQKGEPAWIVTAPTGFTYNPIDLDPDPPLMVYMSFHLTWEDAMTTVMALNVLWFIGGEK